MKHLAPAMILSLKVPDTHQTSLCLPKGDISCDLTPESINNTEYGPWSYSKAAAFTVTQHTLEDGWPACKVW
jgi:hypothetical protein